MPTMAIDKSAILSPMSTFHRRPITYMPKPTIAP